ncbi:MAG TPA: ABC transporter permease [Thermoanaerobaculia bacterium]|nr:ABC transporter permease [Thermoanaerobaculia bacterium]
MGRLRNSLWRRDSQYDLIAEEQEFHIEMRTRDNVARGMSPAEARADAVRRFGNTALLRDKTLDADRLFWADALVRDLRLAVRTLAKRRGLALTAVLSLALGIGANSAIFSIVDAVILRPLPLPDPDRLVVIEESKNGEFSGSNPARLADWAREVADLEAAAGFYGEGLVLTGQGDPARLHAIRTVGKPLAVLGIQPIAGRGFTPEEENGLGARVAMVGEGTWHRRFGGDPKILGRTLRLSGEPFLVIGIVPDRVGYPEDLELLIPAPLDVQQASRQAGFLGIVGRMKPGAALPGLQAQLDTVAARLAKQYPDSDAGRSARPVLLQEEQSRGARLPLLVLLGTAALVLLIACVNIASLLLARAAERQREASIRAALGSGRGGLIRLYLVESLVLAFAGGALGVLLAQVSLATLKGLLPADTPRLASAELDLRVVGFSLVLSLLCGLAFGLAPAWQSARQLPGAGLRDGRRAGTSASGLKTRRLLVATQVTLSVVLLVGVGLLARSLFAMRGVPLGFEPSSVLTVEVDFPWDTPKTRLASFSTQALEGFAALPGVESAGFADRLPFEGGSQSGPVAIDGRPLSPQLAEAQVSHRAASAGYFAAMGIPLVSGRFLSPDGPKQALINETLARTYFPDGGAVGRRLTFDVKPEKGEAPVWFEIAGVVGDVRLTADQSEPMPEVFVLPRDTYWPLLRFALRTRGDAAALAPAVRQVVRRLDSGLVIDGISTLDEKVALATADSSVRVRLLGGFAVLALWLACLGLYGVLSSDVGQRTHEIGVRLALGADSDRVARAVVWQGLSIVLGGLVLGLFGAAALGRSLRALLFGVQPVDGPVLLMVSAVMVTVAFLASYLPAHRAAGVDPGIALRHE